MEVLYFLAELRTPVLDAIMQFFTLFGDEVLFMVIALVFFWCVDKAEGYYLLFVGFFGTILNQFLKLFFHIPRPWQRDPGFQPVEGALGGAGGYSFPSGHTQNVVGTLGGVARWERHRVLRIGCILLAALTAFSRMYLGVHTPADVLVSLAIALVLVFGFYPIMRRAAKNPRLMAWLLGAMVALSLAFVVYAHQVQLPLDTEGALENLQEGKKNSFSLLGALLGFCVAWPLERKYVKFETKAIWWAQILKVSGGLVCVLAIKEGVKALFNALGITWLGVNALRYFAVVLFAALVWPRLFPWFSRLGKEAKE